MKAMVASEGSVIAISVPAAQNRIAEILALEGREVEEVSVLAHFGALREGRPG